MVGTRTSNKVATRTLNRTLCEPQFYDHNSFKPAFTDDASSTLALFVIHCPFITTRAIETFEHIFLDCRARNVRVCVFVQKPRDWDARNSSEISPASAARLQQFQTTILLLESYGVHVSLRDKIHEK